MLLDIANIDRIKSTQALEADRYSYHQKELIELLNDQSEDTASINSREIENSTTYPLESTKKLLSDYLIELQRDTTPYEDLLLVADIGNSKEIGTPIENYNEIIFPGDALEVIIDDAPCIIRLENDGSIGFEYKNNRITLDRIRLGNVGKYEFFADVYPSRLVFDKTQKRRLEKLKQMKDEGLPAVGIGSITLTRNGLSIGYIYQPEKRDPIQHPIQYDIPLPIHTLQILLSKSINHQKVEIFKDDFSEAITYLNSLPNDKLSPEYKEFINNNLESIILHTQILH